MGKEIIIKDLCLIGVDFSETEDCSAVAVRCSNCKSFIYNNTTMDKNEIKTKIFKRCPICDTEFKQTLIYQ